MVAAVRVGSLNKLRRLGSPYLTTVCFVTPLLLLLGAFFLVPLFRAVWLSFTTEQGAASLSNYRRIFGSGGLYVHIFLNTFKTAGLVTVIALLAGYPVAYALARLRGAKAIIVLGLVLFPFWTSTLARTYAWTIILERYGLVNRLLQATGLTSQPVRLLYTTTAVVIGMVHVLLPFMILPIYAVFRRMEWDHVRAAQSLGAGNARVMRHIIWPLSLPGVFAGTMIVFMQALGFFITPALLGGPQAMMISAAINTQISVLLDFGFASALAVVLLMLTLLVLAVMSRLVSLEAIYGQV